MGASVKTEVLKAKTSTTNYINARFRFARSRKSACFSYFYGRGQAGLPTNDLSFGNRLQMMINYIYE